MENEPEIESIPQLVSENEEPNDDEASEEDANVAEVERPRRNVQSLARYSPETGLSYYQVELCHNITTDNHPAERTLVHSDQEIGLVAQALLKLHYNFPNY